MYARCTQPRWLSAIESGRTQQEVCCLPPFPVFTPGAHGSLTYPRCQSVSHRAQRSVHLPPFCSAISVRFRDVALEGVSLDAWCSGPRAALHARSPHRLRPAGTAPAGFNGPVGPSGASFVQEPSHARNGWDQAWHPRDVWLEDAQHKRGTPSFLGVRPFAYSSNSGWMCPCQEWRLGASRFGERKL